MIPLVPLKTGAQGDGVQELRDRDAEKREFSLLYDRGGAGAAAT